MEVRIGIVNAPAEVKVDMSDDESVDSLKQRVESAVAAGGLVWLTDQRGRETGFPAERLAYIEFGAPSDETRIGFS